MARKAALTYTRDFYMPAKTEELLRSGGKGATAVRKEYTRLRDIAQKRVKRLRLDPIFWEADTADRSFKQLKDITSNAELADKLAELADFVQQKTSTVSGAKEVMYKSLGTLHENGFDFVTPENYIKFGKFMEQYRQEVLNGEYDSGEAADAFAVIDKHKIDPEQIHGEFEYWIENRETLDRLYKKQKSQGNAAELRAQHERYLKEQVRREKAQLKRMGY